MKKLINDIKEMYDDADTIDRFLILGYAFVLLVLLPLKIFIEAANEKIN